MADITGNAGGVDDVLMGTRTADTIKGLSGDDYLFGGRGDDLLIGGAGSDVLEGGLDKDTFQWSAGHITEGATDYVLDFSLTFGDKLSFLGSSGGQNVEIVSVTKGYLTETSFNGFDLQNNVATGTDVTFEVRNSVTGATQKIVLLDSWSNALAGQWDALLESLGTSWGSMSEV